MRLILLLIPLVTGLALAADTPYTIATWNVLCDSCTHPEGFAPWDDRKADVMATVAAQNPDIMGFQEVSEGAQLDYVVAQMDGYSACLGSPADTLYNPVFVKNGVDFECFAGFFVYQTRRACTHIQVSGVNYYNCHFPLGEAENLEATQTLLQTTEAPFVFLGDFNTHVDQYPVSHALLNEFVQTREPPSDPLFFYYVLDIDRVGISEHKRVSFTRLETGFLSDHRYLEAEFSNFLPPSFVAAVVQYYLLD